MLRALSEHGATHGAGVATGGRSGASAAAARLPSRGLVAAAAPAAPAARPSTRSRRAARLQGVSPRPICLVERRSPRRDGRLHRRQVGDGHKAGADGRLARQEVLRAGGRAGSGWRHRVSACLPDCLPRSAAAAGLFARPRPRPCPAPTQELFSSPSSAQRCRRRRCWRPPHGRRCRTAPAGRPRWLPCRRRSSRLQEVGGCVGG